MRLCRPTTCPRTLFAALLLSAFFSSSTTAQQLATSGKALTVERIYSMPSLSGRLTPGLTWTPDGKQLSYFETKGSGKEAKTELWVMDATNGERRLLVVADKLESVLPADSAIPTGRFFLSEWGNGAGALSGGGRRESCCSRTDCFRARGRAARHGYRGRDRYLHSARELAERFETHRDSAPQS